MSDLTIFNVLKKIDEQDFNFYNSLPDKDKSKTVPHYMLLKWLALSNDSEKVLMLNSTINKWMFKLNKHPGLMFNVMAACGNGNSERYKWRKFDKKTNSRPTTVELLKEYYNDSTESAITDSKLMQLDEMLEIAERLGYTDKVNKLKKEYNDI
jgi:hypothetical protein